MAIDFTTIQTKQWVGSIIGLPTALCGVGGRAVGIEIDWQDYGFGFGSSVGVKVDLEGINVTTELNRITSVFIDNFANPAPVYILFPDTLFASGAPAFSGGWVPCLTNGLKSVLYGMSFSVLGYGLTRFHFTNVWNAPSISTVQ